MTAIEIILKEVLALLCVAPESLQNRREGADARAMATAVAHHTGLIAASDVAARFSPSVSAVRRNLARHKWRMSRRIYRMNFRLACDVVRIRCKVS